MYIVSLVCRHPHAIGVRLKAHLPDMVGTKKAVLLHCLIRSCAVIRMHACTNAYLAI